MNKENLNVVIVNTGVSNVRSVQNMMKRLNVKSLISDRCEDIDAANVLILPGVGTYDACIRRLQEVHLIESLNKKALVEKVPVLGLCLGMQILGNRSEEGELSGLGWISGELQRLPPVNSEGQKVRVPHMGWNIIRNIDDCILYKNMGNEPRFYFDHSYYFTTNNKEHIYGKATHGIEFTAGIRNENIFGVQFHPEKSHRFGLKLFENFISYACECFTQTDNCVVNN